MKKNRILEQDIQKYCQNIDAEFQKNFVAEYAKIGDSSLYGGKHCGSDAEHAGSQFIAQKLREIGVDQVELIPCETSRYQFNDATLTVTGTDLTIKPYGYVSPGTGPEGLTARIVDAGKASKAELEAIDAKGKIVLFAAMGTLEGANLSGQMEEAIRSGAAGIIIYAVEDVLDEDTIRVQPPNVISEIPIVGVCGRDAADLQQRIESGNDEVTLVVDAEFIPDGGTTYNVVGEIPGTISDERIIYTAHLDHYFRCLQDNMSSCASLLGIAKAIIDSGYKPNRTITFAFHGSHETGGMDTRYPYIFGSYKLTHENMPQWTGTAIVNINFEYTALRMKKLQVIAYPCANNYPTEFYPYAPELTGEGFKEINPRSPQEEYYMLSWSDSISYHTAGIPVITNDPISEQYYEGNGPYVGRDHSNKDNWDIFETAIQEDISRFYGGLGLFLDSMPATPLDFREQADRIRREVSIDALSELGVETGEYFSAVEAFENAAAAAKAEVDALNGAYIEALSQGLTMEQRKEWFDKGRRINRAELEAYRIISDDLDKINAQDFLSLASVKYIQNISMLREAKTTLAAGDGEKALESLAEVDLCLASYYFSEDIVEHMQKQICGTEYADRRTWARGRELAAFTYKELIDAFVTALETGDYDETIQHLDEACQREAGCIPQALDAEAACVAKAAESLRKI